MQTIPHGNNNPTILLVDDESSNLFLLKEILDDYCFNLHTTQNGREALLFAKKTKPSLILMDITMPIMDGITACKAFKADPEMVNIPVIFLTNHNDLSFKLRGFKAGCVDYIVKPFHPQEVIARITLHLGHIRITRNLKSRLKSYEEYYGSLNTTTPPTETQSIEKSQLINNACNILLKNIQEPPKLDDLARQLNTNREYLNTAFRNALGITPFAWLREERLRQAANSLRKTEKPLKKIAYDCGYSSSTSFITGFKKRFGVTPHDFRQNHN